MKSASSLERMNGGTVSMCVQNVVSLRKQAAEPDLHRRLLAGEKLGDASGATAKVEKATAKA